MNNPAHNYGSGFGYMGNPKLRRAFIQISMTQDQVDEFKKCSQDPEYFIRKYVKIVALGKGIVSFDLYPFQADMINTFNNNRFVICKIPRQSGKALPLDENILTSKGFRKFGDLRVGDKVYGKDGKETIVTFITETMYNHDCYNIEFDNGDIVKCDAEHLWEIMSSDWNKKKIIDTNELIRILPQKKKNGSGLYVEMNQSLEFDEKELPIDPYTLGVWLGDGTSRSAQITCHKDDMECYKTNIPYEIGNITYSKVNNNVVTLKVNGLYPLLRLTNLLQNKHIPDSYKMGSIEQRLELLRGLMDTDGHIGKKKGSLEFYQKNEDLIDDVVFILRSLGIKTRKSFRTIDGSVYWKITFATNRFSLFKLKRKKDRQENHKYFEKNNRLYIKAITKSDSVPVRCITVDNDDHMFLIGKNLIPTHNTITTVAYLLWTIIFTPMVNIAIAAHKGPAANGILQRLKLAYENLPLWLQHGIIEWNKGNIELENGSKIGAFATTADGLRSGSYDIVLLDEFAFVPNNIAEAFYTSTYPVITAGTNTKVFIISTPKGMNHFYTAWVKAIKKKSEFIPIEVHWSAVPGRDEAWKAKTISNTSEEQFRQEFECLAGETQLELFDTEKNEYKIMSIEELYLTLNS